MRGGLILLVAIVALILLAGCARDGGAPRSERTQEEGKQIPSTARIVCIRDDEDVEEDAPDSPTKQNEAHNAGTLTRVLAPKVEAQPDGVHYTIDNRMGVDSSYTVDTPPGGGMGDNLPRGESRHIEPFSPGALIRIACDPPDYGGAGYGSEELEYATFEVLGGESGYRSRSLQCSSGGQANGFAAQGGSLKGDPVELARRYFKKDIEEGDVVEVAGYPKSANAYSGIQGYKQYVRVVRNGRVVAVINYVRVGRDRLR
jgi:hypothetical protein